MHTQKQIDAEQEILKTHWWVNVTNILICRLLQSKHYQWNSKSLRSLHFKGSQLMVSSWSWHYVITVDQVRLSSCYQQSLLNGKTAVSDGAPRKPPSHFNQTKDVRDKDCQASQQPFLHNRPIDSPAYSFSRTGNLVQPLCVTWPLGAFSAHPNANRSQSWLEHSLSSPLNLPRTAADGNKQSSSIYLLRTLFGHQKYECATWLCFTAALCAYGQYSHTRHKEVVSLPNISIKGPKDRDMPGKQMTACAHCVWKA